MNNALWASVVITVLCTLLPVATVMAQQEPANVDIPHVNKLARESYTSGYQFADEYKAFAIAPGGAWSWSAGKSSREEAVASALHGCGSYTQQQCVLFAVSDKVVFDRDAWPTLWRPYLNAQQAAKASVGINRGNRFHNLQLKRDGQTLKLSDLRGKVAVLHFWGSWCPHCLRELPSLQTLYDTLVQQKIEVQVVLVQVRESYSKSQDWLQSRELSLPGYDSGAVDEMDKSIRLADGSRLDDRKLARVFPSTFVLDGNGVVIFSHVGPVDDWMEYLSFLKDAVTHSGY